MIDLASILSGLQAPAQAGSAPAVGAGPDLGAILSGVGGMPEGMPGGIGTMSPQLQQLMMMLGTGAGPGPMPNGPMPGGQLASAPQMTPPIGGLSMQPNFIRR